MNELASLFETYRTAVLNKDAAALLSLYAPEFSGFDMWDEWVKTPQSWERMVHEWFSSLGDERVEVSFSDIREIVSPELATAQCFVRYTALSATGTWLRHLDNRLTWVARRQSGHWKIVHEHTSVPITGAGKALMQRA